jgi:Fe2+ or Zn2+ uptake regulation protein
MMKILTKLITYNNIIIVPIIIIWSEAVTKQKKLIMDIIMTSMEHMTAEEIYVKARQIMPSISIGTVYRNLGQMTDDGEIRRIVMPNAPDIFDGFLHPHEHLICQKCRKISNVTISDFHEYLEKQTGVEILEFDLSMKYICDECKSRK